MKLLDFAVGQLGLDELQKGKQGSEFKIDRLTFSPTPKEDAKFGNGKNHQATDYAVSLKGRVDTLGFQTDNKTFHAIGYSHTYSVSNDDAEVNASAGFYR